jgi:hypothetical protein
MAGKTNTSATFFAQKKLLGKAHTSNLKIDGEETIGSNIQAASSLIFGESIPESPTRTLNTVQGTVEYIEFVLEVLTGTTYDANSDGGGSGDDSGEDLQTSGPHAYKFKFPDNYNSISANPNAGTGFFKNDALVHESLGSVQIIPPFFSQDAPNPYIVKVYQDDGSGNAGTEIPLLDNIDWNIDYYNGILFLQDYSSSKIPAFARGFAYIGKMLSTVVSEAGSGGGGGSGDGDSSAEYIVAQATGSLPNAKVIEAGSNISISTGSNTITISSTGASVINGREKRTYFVTSSHAAGIDFTTNLTNYSDVGFDPNKIDVLYNGVLLHTGTLSQINNSERDYVLASTGSIKFSFGLFENDIIDVSLSLVGSSGGGSGTSDSNASYLVLSSTGSLSNERVINIGTGLQFTDDGAGGNYTVEVEKDFVFNDLLSGNADGENTYFQLSNSPFSNTEISIFVNGLLQVPPDKLSFQDYSVTGSDVYFSTGSAPPQGSWIMANYYRAI